MKTLELFNAVLYKDTGSKPFISKQGFIIDSGAVWAKTTIASYYENNRLSGNDLNKTFHKSWNKIIASDRSELVIEQIFHYLSTYGSNFEDEVYIPNEVLNLEGVTLKYRVVKSYNREQFIDKSLNMLKSGAALKKETVESLISLLTELDYKFTGSEGIKNKEAMIILADMFNILPIDSVEFLRYLLYKSTGNTLLIKDSNTINSIKSSSFNPALLLNNFGLEKLSEIFNRFKPLFLAFKSKCPSEVNKIAKLSKKNHKPLVQNPLNLVTSRLIGDNELHWLNNASVFSLFKALQALHSRIVGCNTFLYKIRNGKSWIKEDSVSNVEMLKINFKTICNVLKSRYDLSGKSYYINDNVIYALPTSEKMFIGNIPMFTEIKGDNLSFGIYWENEWGARDLDLSAINVSGKVGWNSSYNQGNGSLMYSGDMTNALNGAVEYLRATNKAHPSLVKVNIYNGEIGCDYKIVVGDSSEVDRDFMMNPKNLVLEAKCKSIQKENIIGFYKENTFTVFNFGRGSVRVSGEDSLGIDSLIQQCATQLPFQFVLELLGAKRTENEEEAGVNLNINNLEKDSFTKIFV